MVYNCEASDAMYNELFTRVKRWLTNRIHGKAAEHSYVIAEITA